jgi:hypothetical protein
MLSISWMAAALSGAAHILLDIFSDTVTEEQPLLVRTSAQKAELLLSHRQECE